MYARLYPLLISIGLTLFQTACSDNPSAPAEAAGQGVRLDVVLNQNANAPVGSLGKTVVGLRDANGKTVKGETLRFGVMSPDGFVRPLGAQTWGKAAEVRTNDDGQAAVEWNLGTKPVRNTLRVAGPYSSILIEVTPGAGPVERLRAFTGDGQRGERNSYLTASLQVQAVDAYENVVRDAPVQFTVISGGGTLIGGPALTDSMGIATSGFWLLGNNTDSQKVEATSGIAKATFSAESLDCSLQPGAAECFDAGQLAFVSESDHQIYTVSSRGTGLTRLTTGGGTLSPAWSPDGTRIAFIKTGGPGYLPAGIVVMNADGSNVSVRNTSIYRSVAWSPDGKFLAVSDEGVYDGFIDIIPVDSLTGTARRLTTMARSPAWSPDGRQIVYTGLSGDDGYHQLYVINGDGTGDHPITVQDAGGIINSSWSPDGRSIAFVKCLQTCDLYTVLANGSAQRQMTNDAGARYASWSPDGKWIALSAWLSSWQPGIKASLYYASADGGSLRTITANASMPSWRPQTRPQP